MKNENLKKKLLDLIVNGTCAFTCVKYLKDRLINEGFCELKETDSWNLQEGKYFVCRNDASLVAFQIPKFTQSFHIVTTHCDTPALLLKPNGANIKEKFLKQNIMPYGGLLHYGWLDHPLSIAGRIFFKNGKNIRKEIVDFKKPMAVIPSVAIHQNDTANSKLDLNAQIDLQPIFALSENCSSWDAILKNYLKIKPNESICDYDFFLYHTLQPMLFGEKEELLLSPRIDNLTSVSAAFESFLESKPKSISVFCTFNHEEIGSLTKEGADSNFLLDILKRIAASLDLDITCTLAQSWIISSDNTHAVHPNRSEYADTTGAAYMGKGFTIVKEISSTTDAAFSTLLKSICDEKKISYQDATAKNDLTGGSTLSGISLRHVSVNSIDVGIAQLAMHSSLEVCALSDYISLYQMMKAFYQIEIQNEKESLSWH